MEESGENWPSDHSDMEAGDDDAVKDFCFEDDGGGGGGGSFAERTDRVAARKERQREISERLLALSATIPASLKKKMDNNSILVKASNYVKQLQERVRELEQEVESSCEVTNSGNHHNGTNDQILPEVRARVLQKEVMVTVHCEKEKGVMLKILSHLENLHLSVVNSSVLRFGKSTLDITIIAQIGDEYNMTVDELVRTLRVAILTQ